jgi:hypothetical protein
MLTIHSVGVVRCTLLDPIDFLEPEVLKSR